MKKNFKFYVLGWVALLGLFNLLAFVIPAWPTLEKFTASFWIGWGVATGAFFGQLICAWEAFKDESAKKTFYNISIFTVSYLGLITMFVVAMICIVITPLPYWVAAIACSAVLIANIVAVVKAKIAVDAVVGVDEKIENSTSFIYEMREKSEYLLASSDNDNMKVIFKKIRDAFKYSDPMSDELLNQLETQISITFEQLVEQNTAENIIEVETIANQLLGLINSRNAKCKRFK